MSILMSFLVFLHILGIAIIVGTWFATMKTPTVTTGQFYGALLMLATGIGMLAGLEVGDAYVNHAKYGVKIVVLLGVLAAAFVGMRKNTRGEPVSTGLAHAVGGLAVINTAIAVFW